jgi:hypothetical protein
MRAGESAATKIVLSALAGIVIGAYVAQKLAANTWGWPRGGVYAMFAITAVLVTSIVYRIARRQ